MTKYIVLRSYEGIPDDEAYGPFDGLNEATAAASTLFQKDLEVTRSLSDAEYVADEDSFFFYPRDNEDVMTEFAILSLKTVEFP